MVSDKRLHDAEVVSAPDCGRESSDDFGHGCLSSTDIHQLQAISGRCPACTTLCAPRNADCQSTFTLGTPLEMRAGMSVCGRVSVCL